MNKMMKFFKIIFEQVLIIVYYLPAQFVTARLNVPLDFAIVKFAEFKEDTINDDYFVTIAVQAKDFEENRYFLGIVVGACGEILNRFVASGNRVSSYFCCP